MVPKGGLEPPTGFPNTPPRKLVPTLRVAGAHWIRILCEPPGKYTDGNA